MCRIIRPTFLYLMFVAHTNRFFIPLRCVVVRSDDACEDQCEHVCRTSCLHSESVTNVTPRYVLAVAHVHGTHARLAEVGDAYEVTTCAFVQEQTTCTIDLLNRELVQRRVAW